MYVPFSLLAALEDPMPFPHVLPPCPPPSVLRRRWLPVAWKLHMKTSHHYPLTSKRFFAYTTSPPVSRTSRPAKCLRQTRRSGRSRKKTRTLMKISSRLPRLSPLVLSQEEPSMNHQLALRQASLKLFRSHGRSPLLTSHSYHNDDRSHPSGVQLFVRYKTQRKLQYTRLVHYITLQSDGGSSADLTALPTCSPAPASQRTDARGGIPVLESP
ncbi:hypothetical protein F4810DRAFT_298770 [Camillea tinctor]|nr:hypothetical protein F4810DRAFT_298770 [Camillea tinctor]